MLSELLYGVTSLIRDVRRRLVADGVHGCAGFINPRMRAAHVEPMVVPRRIALPKEPKHAGLMAACFGLYIKLLASLFVVPGLWLERL
jgi:hypothetical protein